MVKQLLFIPGPVTCAGEVLDAMSRPLVDHRGPEFAELLATIGSGMQPIFGTANEIVVLGCSGTGGLEAAIASSFSPGQKVLGCPTGVFGQRLASIATTYGLEVELLETPLGARVDAEALAARLRADREHALAGVLLTHNETSTGVQNDMAALARAIGDHPATVVVDSVSGLGASAFEMDAWNFDVVVTASQKALGVPPGLALVAVSPRGWERIAKAEAPRFYLDLKRARTFAAQGQTPWTPPVSLAYALEVGIRRYHAEGAAHVFARHERYANAIRAFAAGAALEIFSRPDAHSVTVVAMRVPAGLEAAAIRRELRETHGVVIGGGQAELKGKILRMGTMGHISPTDLLRGLEAFESTLRLQGHPIAERAGVHAARAFLDEQLATTR